MNPYEPSHVTDDTPNEQPSILEGLLATSPIAAVIVVVIVLLAWFF